MSTKCAYHPDISASHACMQCGALICGDCKRRVQNKPACWRCAGEEAAPVVAASEPEPEPVVTQAEAPPFEQSPQPYYAKKTQTLDLKRATRSVLIALLISLAGGVVWEKLAFYAHRQWPFGYLVLGAAIGVAMRAAIGRQSNMMALFSAVIAFTGIAFGHWLLIWDIAPSQLSPDVLPVDVRFIIACKVLPTNLRDMPAEDLVLSIMSLIMAFIVPSTLVKEKT